MTKVIESRNYKAIYAMDRICFPTDTPQNPHTAKWWTVHVGGEYAGYAGAKVLLGANAVYLCRAGVLPKYRGRGFQLRMIRSRVRWAQGLRDVDTVITDTRHDNVSSSNNLIKAGFLMYEPEEPWLLDGALYWRKDL